MNLLIQMPAGQSVQGSRMHKNSLLVLSMRENAVFLSGFRICKRLQVSHLHFSVQTQGKQANEQKWNPAKISKPSSAQVALARNGSHSRCRRTSGSMPVPIPDKRTASQVILMIVWKVCSCCFWSICCAMWPAPSGAIRNT